MWVTWCATVGIKNWKDIRMNYDKLTMPEPNKDNLLHIMERGQQHKNMLLATTKDTL